jgi:hypothetical protein
MLSIAIRVFQVKCGDGSARTMHDVAHIDLETSYRFWPETFMLLRLDDVQTRDRVSARPFAGVSNTAKWIAQGERFELQRRRNDSTQIYD